MKPAPATDIDDQPVSRWAQHGDVRLHFLDARRAAAGPVVLLLPGFGEEARDHLPLLAALSPRRVVAVDLRGRGPSTLTTRYRLEDHVADLQAVVAEAGIDCVHLVTYSRGTTYGLAWAFAHLDQIASISIGDYPPAQIVPPPVLAEMAVTRIWKGRPMIERMPLVAVEALIADATPVDFWAEMSQLRCPVLVMRGGAPGAMIDSALEDRYRRSIADLRVVRFDESRHDLWTPDPERFATTIRAFLDEVEEAPPSSAIDPPGPNGQRPGPPGR